MIKFFRKIRQNLLMENKTVKYFKYAIGEIALVVIGILIALQINNWNEEQKSKITERKILMVLVENLEKNIQSLDWQITRLKEYDKSGEIIKTFLNTKKVKNDSLGKHFHKALNNGANFTLSKSGYEPFKNTGIEIIRNDGLKKSIISLFENSYLILEGRLKWGNQPNPYISNYIIEHFKRDANGILPRDYDFIFNDVYFLGLLELTESQRGFEMRFFENSLEETQKVLQQLNNELN